MKFEPANGSPARPSSTSMLVTSRRISDAGSWL